MEQKLPTIIPQAPPPPPKAGVLSASDSWPLGIQGVEPTAAASEGRHGLVGRLPAGSHRGEFGARGRAQGGLGLEKSCDLRYISEILPGQSWKIMSSYEFHAFSLLVPHMAMCFFLFFLLHPAASSSATSSAIINTTSSTQHHQNYTVYTTSSKTTSSTQHH